MKYVDEFRDGTLAAGLARAIAREADSGRDRDAVDLDEETPLHGVRPFEALVWSAGAALPRAT